MSTEYSWKQGIVRIGLAVMVLVWPITGFPTPLSPFALAIGAVLAYNGVTRGSILWCLVWLLSAEWIYDIPAGVLTISYMVCAITMVGLRRWLSVSPFVGENGWALSALARTIILGCTLAVVATVTAIVISSTVYGNGLIGQRIILQLGHTPMLVGAGVIVAGMVVVLARVDRPWRRPITYGI